MPLEPMCDVSVMDWVVEADESWTTLVTQGPPGFEAYATVWFDLESPEADSDVTTMDRVLAIAAARTTTPDDAFVAVWPGWGWWEHEPVGPRARLLGHDTDPRFPVRDYVLLTTAVERATDPTLLGVDGTGSATPHAVWPVDRAWYLASDIDPEFLTLGGTQELIDAVLTDDALECYPVAYGERTPNRINP